MPRTNATDRVGTLDAVNGRKLSVYMRADGSLFFKIDGVREDMHGNTRWTSTSGAKMRGKTLLLAARTHPPIASERTSPQADVGGTARDARAHTRMLAPEPESGRAPRAH